MADSISVQLNRILEEYSDEVKDVVRKDTGASARETARTLKGSSPKKTGDYASGWSSKQIDDTTAVTYNRKMPGLTHLLEKGHVVRNKKGYFGRAAARPHIAPAADKGETDFIQRVERDLS